MKETGSTKLGASNLGDPSQWPFYINGRDDVIFIHIPKTAGTSIRRSLNFNRVDTETDITKHNDLKMVISLIGIDKWNDSYKFAFVRNPWERILSHYHFAMRKRDTRNLRKHSFKQWVLKKMLLPEEDMVPLLKIEKKLRFNLQPQIRWVQNQDGIVDVDFIGRFEHLERDFRELTNILSLPAELPHTNQNPQNLNYRDHYDSELKEKVTRFYQEDVDYFKYTF